MQFSKTPKVGFDAKIREVKDCFGWAFRGELTYEQHSEMQIESKTAYLNQVWREHLSRKLHIVQQTNVVTKHFLWLRRGILY